MKLQASGERDIYRCFSYFLEDKVSQALNTLARNLFTFFLGLVLAVQATHSHTILFYAHPAVTQTNGGILGYLEFNTVFYQRKLLLVYPLTPELDPQFLYSPPEMKGGSM